jgi:SWI/SNF-related matrix-associated actin-dependent regulator 1 of chromatin subfamily A
MSSALEPYPFQKTGVDWLAGKKTALLADEMGLGKSVQAIQAADRIKAESILVICPKSVTHHWVQEFRTWQTKNRAIGRIKDGSRKTTDALMPGVYIINYDKISQKKSSWIEPLSKTKWDVVILDECHALKNRSAQRTKAIYGFKPFQDGAVIKNAKRVWLLSGTPAPNHAGELWTHLHTLHPKGVEDRTLRSEDKFQEAYTHQRPTQWGMQITGSKNMSALRKKHLESWMLRRKKKDVISDMPELSFVAEPLDITNLPENHRAAISQAFVNVDNWTIGLSEDEILTALRPEVSTSYGNLSKAFHEIGLLKADLAAEYIKENFANRPVLVFAWHRAVLERLNALLAAMLPAMIHGGVGSDKRAQLIEHFQAGRTKLFLGQIAAAGEGITLTAASDVIFVEGYWTPAKIHQAACRAHRIGQKYPVVARMLTIPGSVDDAIQRTLVRKSNQLTELFG